MFSKQKIFITGSLISLLLIEIVETILSGRLTIMSAVSIAILILLTVMLVVLNKKIRERHHFYEQIIDAVPLPVSVTDMNMNWTFLNKFATDPLGITRADITGQQCKNWGADICGTDKCGISCLRKGVPTTFFHQWDKDFEVTSSYLTGLNGEEIGHIEIVQEITDKVALQNIYYEVEKISLQVSNGSSQLNVSSQSLSQGASEQAAAIEQISSSLNEIQAQATANAENASKASQLAGDAESSAENASKEMRDMISAMNEINESSTAISKIIKVIDEIAFQTNLLALNAAVEAARAGQHGKGFAVVAEEVRNLAGRSAKAAQETSDIIEASTTKVSTGSEIAARCADALNSIVEKVINISTVANEIDVASNEQAEGISQTTQGLAQVDQVIQSTASAAEETASSSAELSNSAKLMQQQLDAIKKIEGLFDNQDALNSNTDKELEHISLALPSL